MEPENLFHLCVDKGDFHTLWDGGVSNSSFEVPKHGIKEKSLWPEKFYIWRSLGRFELLQKFSLEWVGGSFGRAVTGRCTTPNFFSQFFARIWKVSNSIQELLKMPHFGGGGGKSCSKTAQSGASNVGTRNLSNPGCDARNPGGGTKVEQLSFQFWSNAKLTCFNYKKLEV